MNWNLILKLISGAFLTIMLLILAYCGFIIGSWIVTVIERKKANIPLPPSCFKVKWKFWKDTSIMGWYCFNCKTELKKEDMVPVISYIKNKGKCKYCGTKIGITTLLWELGFGVFLVIIAITILIVPKEILI